MTPWIFRPFELLERLNEANVRFIVGGGLAVGAWGYIRGTKNLDIVPDPDEGNLARFTTALEELDGRVVVGDRVLEGSAVSTFLRAGDKTLVRTEIGEVRSADRRIDWLDIEALETAHSEDSDQQ